MENEIGKFTVEQLSQKWYGLLNQKVFEALILENQVLTQGQLIQELVRKEAELTNTIQTLEEKVEGLEKPLRQEAI